MLAVASPLQISVLSRRYCIGCGLSLWGAKKTCLRFAHHCLCLEVTQLSQSFDWTWQQPGLVLTKKLLVFCDASGISRKLVRHRRLSLLATKQLLSSWVGWRGGRKKRWQVEVELGILPVGDAEVRGTQRDGAAMRRLWQGGMASRNR